MPEVYVHLPMTEKGVVIRRHLFHSSWFFRCLRSPFLMNPASKLLQLEDRSAEAATQERQVKTDAEILIEGIVAMSETRSIGEIGPILCAAARDLSSADGSSFVMKEGDECVYVDENVPSPLFKGQRFPLHLCITGWCMRMKRDVVIEDIYVDERIPIEAYRQTFVRSLLVVPVGKADPLAAISAYWSTAHSPSAEEVRALQLLADAAELAIQDKVQGRESSDRITRLKRQRSGLMRAAQSPMVGQGDSLGMSRFVTEQLLKVTGADQASVWLLDTSGKPFVCRDHCESPGFKHTALDFTLERSDFPGYFAKLEMEQHVTVEAREQEVDAIEALISPLLSPMGTISEFAVGVQMVNALVGVICISSNKARHWQDDEIRFALALASQLQITLATEQRKNAENQLAEVNAHLDQLVRERTAQLEAANAELDTFAKTLSHDLKNPIAVIETNCWFIRDQCEATLLAALERPLARIESTSKRMRDQIAAMVTLYHLSQTDIVRKECNLTAMVKDISESLSACGDQAVQVTIQEGLVDSASPELLRSALENLLSNAFKYSARNVTPQIDFGAEPTEDDRIVVYHVRDNGVGFSMAQSDRLFGLFQRLHSASQFEGDGIGLASTKRIIQNHGGRIWAESEPNKGATFYFTLQNST